MPDIAHPNRDTFWHYAEITHTYKRGHARNKFKRYQHDTEYGEGKFRCRRRYKDPRTGEVRETIEIERTPIG